MNDADFRSDETGRFLSVDCIDFWLEGPGDHSVRPIPSDRLEHAKAERAKVLAAQAEVGLTPAEPGQKS